MRIDIIKSADEFRAISGAANGGGANGRGEARGGHARRPIDVPGVQSCAAEYARVAELRAARVSRFLDQNKGYYRHLDSAFPQQIRYEADDEDIHNLAYYYPTEVSDAMSSAQLAHNALVADFEAFVEYIETSEQYREKEPNFGELKASPAILRNFLVIWRRKCTLLKRLLCRQFWRTADTNRDFGPADRRCVAFAPRDKKSSRTNTFRRDAETRLKLERLKRDNELALVLVELVLRREELKLLRIQTNWLGRDGATRLSALRAAAETSLARVRALTEGVAAQHRLESLSPRAVAAPPVAQSAEPRAEPPRPAEPPRVDNDLASFVCSLAAAMQEYQLFITDIQKAKFVLVNRKIRYSKTARCNLVVERRVSLSAAREPPRRAELHRRVLVDTGECFLTKRFEPSTDEAPLCPISTAAALRAAPRRLGLARLLCAFDNAPGAHSLSHIGLLLANGERRASICPTAEDGLSTDECSAEDALQAMRFEERLRLFGRRTGEE